MRKPKVFIGSSSEALEIAKAIELRLANYCDTTTWDSGVFKLSRSGLENLEETVKNHEFAVLVLAPDDFMTSRSKRSFVPRDNVVFELGMFVGRIGRLRTFIATDPNKVKIPSDWLGIKVAALDWDRAARSDETIAAVSPACTEILQSIKSAPIQRSEGMLGQTPKTHISGTDELYLAIARRSGGQSGVVVSHEDTSWAWKLFPTILEWRLSGVPLTLFLAPAYGDQKYQRQERYRRKLVQNLGARVIRRKLLPFKGFFLDVSDDNDLEAVILSHESSGYRPLAATYDADEHYEAAKALLGSIPTSWRHTHSDFRPVIRKYPDTEVCKILKACVSQYKAQGITIRPTQVKTRELMVISRYTRAYKYKQVEYLEKWYRHARVQPFKALRIILQDGTISIMTPPVVERTPHGLVVIEGNTRATFCLQNRLDEFFCLLVEGVSDPLPSVPCLIKDVKISEMTLSPSDRMDAFDYGRFRHIERAVHPY